MEMNKEEMKGFINTTTDPVTKPRRATCEYKGIIGISLLVDEVACVDWVVQVERD